MKTKVQFTKHGFTLLELLLTLSIVAVLLSIGFLSLQRFRAGLELRQAQQTFVQTLNRARSDARRLSQDQVITWTDKTVTVRSNGEEREIPLTASPNIILKKESGGNRLVYQAPYGRLKATNFAFDIIKSKDVDNVEPSLGYRVYVYGITGKVVSGAF